MLWRELEEQPSKIRILTGERTTGALHIGHYFGSLKSRVTLQNWGVELFLCWQITRPSPIEPPPRCSRKAFSEINLDYLAVGIQPEKSTIFCHSMVPSLNS
jgi:tryptophanyl-tRNA synthetase